MKNCILIPARYHAKRIPRKPLFKINNDYLITLTIKKILKKYNPKDVYVCTDNQKIRNIVKKYLGNNSVLIKKNCLNGTERCSYAVKKIKKKYDNYIIISCDMPFIDPAVIKYLEKKFSKENKNISGATVHAVVNNKKTLKDRSIAKIILSNSSRIIYLSRSQIPGSSKFIKKSFFSHHGIVILRKKILEKYSKIKNSFLQKTEDNEWLKLIENDYVIKSYLYKKIFPEINTIKDIKKFLLDK